MEASFVDLRKKSADIIRALRRKERVTVLYRGKPAAIMAPIDDRGSDARKAASQHTAFGIWADRTEDVRLQDHVRGLRGRRFDDC